MYVILDTKYFDESMVGSEVIGYFTSYELAEQYLFENDYELAEYHDDFYDESSIKYYTKESEFEYDGWNATIEKLELIK